VKKIKFNYNNKEFNGELIEDNLFLGGSKVIFQNEDNITCVLALKLLKILYDEK
jgi:hypothetical protein